MLDGAHNTDIGTAGKSQEASFLSVDNRMLVTIELEDYFHVGAFSGVIPETHWSRFEKRIESSTRLTLDLLDQYDVKATFFVMGLVADQIPELIREVADRGHEIASQGYSHRTIKNMSRAEFRDDLIRSREALERATGREILGHRVPHFLPHASLWALDVMAAEGVCYDSSVRPVMRQYSASPQRRFIHEHHYGNRKLIEVPISTSQVGGLYMPLAAGNGLRQFPQSWGQNSVAQWMEQHNQPFVTYFHVWELDPRQPRIGAGSFLTRVRHYRNLDKMEDILSYYFQKYDCIGIAEHLQLEAEPLSPEHYSMRDSPNSYISIDGISVELPAVEEKTPVSIVIPCYNESESIVYLKNTLKMVRRKLGPMYELAFIFVDDGSSDGTGDKLEEMFGDLAGHQVVRHEKNQGVSAAMMTGIRAAETEVVCSMDCDCTYDPVELGNMIPKLGPNTAMVTASPYHPNGRVVNVPEWRLFLSRGASFLYKMVLQEHLSTYTSCFRVYRRSKVADIPLEEGHFLGVAELLCKLALSGEEIKEHPATLESRIFGQSKMKTLSTIRGHLRLLAQFAMERARHGKSKPVLKEPGDSIL